MAPFGSLCTSSSCILLFLRIARKRALGFSLSYIGFYVYILLTFFVIVARCTCLTTLSFDTVVPSVGATKKKWKVSNWPRSIPGTIDHYSATKLRLATWTTAVKSLPKLQPPDLPRFNQPKVKSIYCIMNDSSSDNILAELNTSHYPTVPVAELGWWTTAFQALLLSARIPSIPHAIISSYSTCF